MDEQTDDNQKEKYKVSGQVGTLIAQKLLKGENLRVGRNGELINPPINNDKSLENSSTDFNKNKYGLFLIIKKYKMEA